MIQIRLLGTQDDKFLFNEDVWLMGIPEKGDIIEFEEKDYCVSSKRFNAEIRCTSKEPTIRVFAELKP